MMNVALDPAYRRVSVEEFLEMDFGGAKAELDDGIIFMMTGGNVIHARIAANILSYLRIALRGSDCTAFGSDLAARTGDRSIRFPDVSVHCGNPSAPENDTKQLLGDPQVVIEVLSPSTSMLDQTKKLEEYRGLDGVREILLVDPRQERVRLVRRAGVEAWSDAWLSPGTDVELLSLGITLPHAEIFARD